MQDNAGLCHTVHESAGQCRTMQYNDDNAGQCKTMQYSVGKCRSQSSFGDNFRSASRATVNVQELDTAFIHISSFCK